MSESVNTLAGLLLLNDQNMAAIYPSNVLDDAPVLRALFAQKASQGGTLHKYVRRITAATAKFRNIGIGVANTAEAIEEVDCICKILDGSFTRDVALAAGFAKGRSAYIQRETFAALKAAFFALETAIFNANGNVNINKFKGLQEFAEYCDTGDTQVVNAGGAGGKSVWLLRSGEDAVSLIAGNDGRINMEWDDDNPTIIQVAQGAGYFSAYLITLLGYFGLQVGSAYDAVRIANLDGTSDDLLTDDVLGDALSKFPASRPPTMICMNRTALKELQQSRTATNPTGAPAPFPTEAFGIPIIVTDALATDETTVDATTTTTTTTTTPA
jgi:hypothetical protein